MIGIQGDFDIIGAAGPKAFFSRVERERLAHGYLFTGSRGVGKKTFAHRLAQSLLCERPKQTLLGYCGECAACRSVRGETHPDLFVSAGELKIGDRDSALGFHESLEMTSRDLVRQMSLHSYAGGWRVFILGDVEFAGEPAANALLKFFEEPPPRVSLLLTTDAPGRLLATIRSRLVEIRFPALAVGEVERILLQKSIAPGEARRVAPIAGGSAARALDILDDAETGLRQAVAAWFFQSAAGQVPPIARSRDSATWPSRDTLDEGLEVVKTLVRDWIASTLGGGAKLLASDQAAGTGALPERDPRWLSGALASVSEAQKLARTNVSPALVADFVRVRLAPPP